MDVANFPVDEFKKWTLNQCIIKYTDMDPTMVNEAKENITSGIEKASGATGCNIEVSFNYF